MPSTTAKISTQEHHLVHFYVNGRAYAIDIHRIQEIIYYREVTPIPKAASFILGVIDLRGQIIPVVSLKERLDLNATQSDPDGHGDQGASHILIVKLGARTVGLVVDGVKEVIRLKAGSIHPPDSLFRDQDCKYMEGICHFNDQLILVLDLDRLLSVQELESLEHV
jgi:purine-binding chemotaxis protein CheW